MEKTEPPKQIIYFKSPKEFRIWLKKNHAFQKELFVGFYKKESGLKGIAYHEAVDQALCFGWIDGIKKRVDDVSYMHRLSPRKKGSIWSSVNIKRADELINLGQMHPAGLKAFQERDREKQKLYSYERSITELDDSFIKLFKKNTKAWDFFQLQPPSYKKVAALWVTSAKKDQTKLSRLNTLIEDSANSKRLKVVSY